MGIIKSIRKMFSKNIDCSELLDNTPFHFYSQKSRVVTIGSNIVVKDGFEAVFVCRDKVTDILPAGKYSIIAGNLPKTFKRLHLLRAKGGNFATKFRADIYFVAKTQINDLRFCGSVPYRSKSRRFGRIKGYPEGYFSINIFDSAKLVSCLLKERPYINDVDFLNAIGTEVGNLVNESLMSIGKGFVDIVTNPNEVSELLSGIPLRYLGCELLKINLVSIKIPEKLEQKVAGEIENRREVNVEINEIYGTSLDEKMPNISNGVVEEKLNVDMAQPTEKGSAYKNCLACGSLIDKNANFCPDCGRKQNLF